MEIRCCTGGAGRSEGPKSPHLGVALRKGAALGQHVVILVALALLQLAVALEREAAVHGDPGVTHHVGEQDALARVLCGGEGAAGEGRLEVGTGAEWAAEEGSRGGNDIGLCAGKRFQQKEG